MSHPTKKPAEPSQPEGTEPADVPMNTGSVDPAIEVNEQTPDGGRPGKKAVPRHRRAQGGHDSRRRDGRFAAR